MRKKDIPSAYENYLQRCQESGLLVMEKKASAPIPQKLDEKILDFCERLRSAGLDKQAQEIETNFMNYKGLSAKLESLIAQNMGEEQHPTFTQLIGLPEKAKVFSPAEKQRQTAQKVLANPLSKEAALKKKAEFIKSAGFNASNLVNDGVALVKESVESLAGEIKGNFSPKTKALQFIGSAANIGKVVTDLYSCFSNDIDLANSRKIRGFISYLENLNPVFDQLETNFGLIRKKLSEIDYYNVNETYSLKGGAAPGFSKGLGKIKAGIKEVTDMANKILSTYQEDVSKEENTELEGFRSAEKADNEKSKEGYNKKVEAYTQIANQISAIYSKAKNHSFYKDEVIKVDPILNKIGNLNKTDDDFAKNYDEVMRLSQKALSWLQTLKV